MGDIPNDIELGANRESGPTLLLGKVDGAANELCLSDILDGLVCRTSRSEGSGIHLRVTELPGEGDLDSTNVDESMHLQERFAHAGPSQ
jgi:hypothetical protein